MGEMKPVILKGGKVSLATLLKKTSAKAGWFNDRSTVRALFNSAQFTCPKKRRSSTRS
ncbi:hypothetical protein [Thermococcus sp. 21S7]|uniref:hypothetical protein n=1 Tax=Thermococcus sp. 21S7 TaxID=1638221 RepID=UPI001F1152D6|nr:hypothetical protein [Thermococcus sp. 21S7]